MQPCLAWKRKGAQEEKGRTVKTEYTRTINKSSLVITPEKDCEAEKDCMEMFRYNQISHFLKMEPRKKNITQQFCYDITGRRSLEQLLEYKTLDYWMLCRILHSLDQACMQAEDFMMTEDDILLEPEFVFADNQEEQMAYCYLPGNQVDICGQFKIFMEYLLKTMDHKDEKAVQLAYSVYQQVVEERTALHDVLKNQSQRKYEEKQILFEQSPVVQYVKEDIQSKLYEASPNSIKNQGVTGIEAFRANQDCARTEAFGQNQGSVGTEVFSENQGVAGTEAFRANQGVAGTEAFGRNQETAQHNSASVWKQIGQNYTQLQQEVSLQDASDKRNQPKQQTQPDHIDSARKKPEKANQQDCLTWHIPQKEDLQEKKEEQVSKVQQKETLRKQAAEKLKKMLRRKIYTDRSQEDEVPVFEADTEEEIVASNPTVCLMPETDSIQNQFVYQGADRSRDFHCMSGRMILGSDRQDSDICISLPMVSRVHARVVIDAQGTFIEDLNSTNGTHVNGELLQYKERRMLQKGDIISLAGESYSFH